MRSYIKFEYIDWDRYVAGRLSTLYKQIGILPMLEQAVNQEKIDPRSVVAPNHIYANEETITHMRKVIEKTWKYYDVDRNSGNFINTDAINKKRRSPKVLSLQDKAVIENIFQQWGPTRNNGIPNDCIWIDFYLDEEQEN